MSVCKDMFGIVSWNETCLIFFLLKRLSSIFCTSCVIRRVNIYRHLDGSSFLVIFSCPHVTRHTGRVWLLCASVFSSIADPQQTSAAGMTVVERSEMASSAKTSATPTYNNMEHKALSAAVCGPMGLFIMDLSCPIAYSLGSLHSMWQGHKSVWHCGNNNSSPSFR